MFSSLSSQPRLRLYTRPSFYAYALRNRVVPYSDDYVRKAEIAIEQFTGAKHAVFCSMGRTAIYEGLKQLLSEGDEIILSPMTVPEVISMVLILGAIPVFCDTRDGSWNIDPENVEELITERTKAVMTTHLYGNCDSIDEISAICTRHGLAFIEDAAQALGSNWKGKAAGTFGDFGIYSFSYPKNVSSFYGGMLVTNNSDLAQKVRNSVEAKSPQDRKWYYKKVTASLIKDVATMDVVYPWGVAPLLRFAYRCDVQALKKFVEVHLPERTFNELPEPYATRPSGLQGKICLEKFSDIEKEARHRINAALIYDNGLKDIPEITLPPMYDDTTHTYLYYPIEVPDRKKLMEYMISRGRDVAYQHIVNCASSPAFAAHARNCPNAERTANCTLTLPTYSKYRLDEAERNVAVIREFFGKKVYRVE